MWEGKASGRDQWGFLIAYRESLSTHSENCQAIEVGMRTPPCSCKGSASAPGPALEEVWMIGRREAELGRAFPEAPGTYPTLAFTYSGCAFPWDESTSPYLRLAQEVDAAHCQPAHPFRLKGRVGAALSPLPDSSSEVCQ